MPGGCSPGLPRRAGTSAPFGLWQRLRGPLCRGGSAGGAGAAGGARAASGARSRRSLSPRWLARSLPAYGTQAAAVLQPQLELLWARSGEVAQHASQLCSSLLAGVRDGLPRFAEWVRTLPGARLPGGTGNAGVAGAWAAAEPVSGV